MSSKPNLFEYGLNDAQEARALALHKEMIIVDMLFQGPVGPLAFTDEMVQAIKAEHEKHRDVFRTSPWARALPARMAVRGEFDAFRDWWDQSGITAGNRQLDLTSTESLIETLAVATLQFDGLDWLTKALTAGDIRQAKTEDKHAGFLSAQNTEGLGHELDLLNLLHKIGLRMLQLTYNSMNFVGTGCTERVDAGLSYFGGRLIERMNELGILVDTAHCGRQTTLDAATVSSAPVVASHTASQQVFRHTRGKSDEELVAIAETGGVIGIATCNPFLSDDPLVTIEHFLDHIDYTVRLVGIEHVGVGTDWPLSLPTWGLELIEKEMAPKIGFRPEHNICWTDTIEGFRDYREYINITRGLVKRGYSDKDIEMIMGGNWLRVIEQVWG